MKVLSNQDKLNRKADLSNKLVAKIEITTEKLKAYKAKLKTYTKEINSLRKLVDADNKVVSIKKSRPKKLATA